MTVHFSVSHFTVSHLAVSHYLTLILTPNLNPNPIPRKRETAKWEMAKWEDTVRNAATAVFLAHHDVVLWKYKARG